MYLATIFSGIGVAEMAHRKVFGYNGTIFACEIDKFARLSYEANALNYQNALFYEDVRTLDATKYRGQIGILVGGSPCQDFSIAGGRAGTAGDRGNLIWQYYRIVKECRPEVFVFENVKGFLSIEKGKAYVNFLNAFRDLGYHCHAGILNTKDYGVPQNRERLYIVGLLDADRYFSFHFAPKEPLKLTLGDMLEPYVDEKYFLSERAIECFKKKAIIFEAVSVRKILAIRQTASLPRKDIARRIPSSSNEREASTKAASLSFVLRSAQILSRKTIRFRASAYASSLRESAYVCKA